MNKKRVLLMLILCITSSVITAILFKKEVKASAYDNAYTFYDKYAKDSDKPARLNKEDGYIYFCSWGLTATTGVKYKTVGYSIRINVGGKNDSVEVKLGGSIVKNVSTVSKGKYTYVLRRAKLCRLQSLFSGNDSITWNDIYRKKNTYDFNAIMTVSENGTDLCGTVSESGNLRTISAKNNSYLYRTLSGIKNARNWASPDDLDTFFGKKISLEAVSPLDVSPMNIVTGADNIYPYEGSYYVRSGSDIVLYFDSNFDDPEAVCTRYHPNYNVYKVTGWGDNDLYYLEQSYSNKAFRAGIGIGSDGAASPMRIKGVDSASTTYEKSPMNYRSSVKFYFAVPDSGTIYVKPEGRVYYNNRYPEDENYTDNLCDSKTNSDGKITLLSDGEAPVITVNDYIRSFAGASVNIPFSVIDSMSGIKAIYLYNKNNSLVDSIIISSKTNSYSSNDAFTIKAYQDDEYYIVSTDNVGNRRVSGRIQIVVPRNYVIDAKASGGKNGFNTTWFDICVSGGSTELCSFLVYSDPDENVAERRIIIENRDIYNRTLARGLYRYDFNRDIMSYIRYYADGEYSFNIVSGGELTPAENKYLTLIKDTTSPQIRYYVKNLMYNGWYRTDAKVKVEVDDNLSGADKVELFCDNDIVEGSVEQEMTGKPIDASFTISEEGIHYITVVAYDRAGNDKYKDEMICIDKTPPSLEMSEKFEGIETPSGKWFSKEGFDGKITLHDDLSGVLSENNQCSLYIDKGGFRIVPYDQYEIRTISENEAEFTFSDAYKDAIVTSQKTYALILKDAVGNEVTELLYLKFDCDRPIVSKEIEGAWNPVTRQGKLKLTDEHSGLRKITVFCDGIIVNKDYYEGAHESIVNLNLHDITDEASLIRIEVEDMVGNTTNYVLETASVDGMSGNIRTRLR